MPGLTPVYGIPYPLATDVIDPSVWAAFADRVNDILVDFNDQYADDIAEVPYVWLRRNPAQTIAVTTTTAVSWENPPIMDPNGMFNPANPTRITVPRPGFYMVTVEGMDGQPITTINGTEVGITLSGSTMNPREVKRAAFVSNAGETTLRFLCPVPAAGQFFEVTYWWSGTGGPVTLFNDAQVHVGLVVPI